LISVAAFFWRRLDTLAVAWVTDGIYSVCPLVPLVSLGLVYLKRNRLRELPAKPSLMGLAVVALAVLGTVWLDHVGILVLSLTPVLLIFTLAGVVLATWGWATLRQVAFPLAFLLFLLPVPPRVMSAIDFPLQALCTRTTVGLANLAGLRLQSAGAQLQFPDPNLAIIVAPACNGLRSAVSLLAIAAVYAYILKGSRGRRFLLLAAAIPLAYFGNLVRLLSTVGILQEAGERALKYMPMIDPFLGLAAFSLSLGLLFLLARGLKCSEFQLIA
jgi:exosortase